MNKIVSKTIEVNTELEAYSVKLTDGWSAKALRLPNPNSKLYQIIFDLLADLRSVTVTASMPHQLVSQLPAFYGGLVGSSLEPDSTAKIANAVTFKLGTKLDLDVSTLQAIRAACLEVGAEIEEASRSASTIVKNLITPKTVWAEYVKDKGFQVGLWGTQRICFVAICNAYESYMLRCVRIAIVKPTFRKKSEDKFRGYLQQHFGQKVVDECWLSEELKNARLVRNALSHYGGRVTDELKQTTHPYVVADDVVQIKASDNIDLLRVLEKAVLTVSEVANTLTQFDG